MGWIKKIKYYHVLLVVSIFCLVPIFILCFYDRPNSDDFSYAILTHKCIMENGNIFDILKAGLDFAIYTYKTWMGNFITTMIGSLHPGIFGGRYYIFAPILTLIWIYVSIRYTIGTINKYYMKQSKCAVTSLSLWLLSFFVMWMPSIKEGVYWFCGVAVYTISFFALIMNIGIFINMYNINNKKKNIIYVIISCLLSFLAADGHIIVSFTSLLVTFTIVMVFIIKKKFLCIIPFAVCLIRFIFNYFSPGLNIRSTYFEIELGYFETIILSMSYAKNYIFFNSNVVLFSFLFSLTPFMIKMIKNTKTTKYSVITLPLIIIFSFLLLSAIMCVPTFSLSGNYEMWATRIFNIIWYIFIILYIIIYYFILKILYLSKILYFDNIKEPVFIFIIIICCIVIAFGTDSSEYRTHSNFVRSSNEIKSNVASSYASEIDERETLLTKSKNKNVMVKPLYSFSNLLCFSDLTENKDHWINKDIAEYYDLISVYTGYE